MSEHVLTDEDARTYLDLGMSYREVPLLRWPDLTEAEADWILWERTPFPMVDGIHDLADAVANLSDEPADQSEES